MTQNYLYYLNILALAMYLYSVILYTMSSDPLTKKKVDFVLQNFKPKSEELQLYEDSGIMYFLGGDRDFPDIKEIVDRINHSNDPYIAKERKRYNLPITIKKLVIGYIDTFTQFPESICQLDLHHLKISETKLSGVLPDCLCDLTMLTGLVLSNNKITGLPNCIGNLTHLTTLILNDNELTVLPDSIGTLTHLTNLELNNNKLTVLPDSIGALSNLATLSLENNQLLRLPDSISNLSNVGYLSLAENKLTRLPDSIGELSNINFLGLESNNLLELPESIGELVNLTYLNVDNNADLNILPQTIGFSQSVTVYIEGTGFYNHYSENIIPFWENVKFVPEIPVPYIPIPEPGADVDANEVHDKAADVRYVELTQFLKEKTGKYFVLEPQRFSTYIHDSMLYIINNCYPDSASRVRQSRKRRRSHSRTRSHGGTRRLSISNSEKAELLRGLSDIMTTRLDNIDYSEFSPLVLEVIFYTLEYVKMQSPAFQKPYVKAFVKDCITAYKGAGEEAMTCVGGALERIVLSLEIACTLNSSPDNQQILSYLTKATMNPNEVVLQWYKDNKGCRNFPKESWDDEAFKTNSLRDYLLDKIQGSKPDDFNKIIEDTKAGIGMECPDDFGYGVTPMGGTSVTSRSSGTSRSSRTSKKMSKSSGKSKSRKTRKVDKK